MTDTPWIDGLAVGHWQDEQAMTGCTVVLLPPGSVASGEIRGGAPGTREWAMLAPERRVDHVDAVVLTGGSAFGLATADGVVRWLEARGAGWPTTAGPVPIVVGLVLYDLGVGDSTVRPDATAGYAAASAATVGPGPRGSVGAGTGATVGKWWGRDGVRPGGLGRAVISQGSLLVAAIMAVNAVGDLRPAGPEQPPPPPPVFPSQPTSGSEPSSPPSVASRESTTIGVMVTNAVLSKSDCLLLAQSGHDGMARALEPVHTQADGDGLVAVATGTVVAPLDQVRVLGARAVEAAIRDALA